MSPSSVYRDRYEKKTLYERFGVREYWIVDPANEAIEVFVLEEGRYELHAFAAQTGVVSSRVLDGLVPFDSAWWGEVSAGTTLAAPRTS